LTEFILSLSRLNKILLSIVVDSISVILVLFISISLRLGEIKILGSSLYWEFFAAPFIAIPIFFQFGLYRTTIRFIGFNSLWSIVQAVSLYALIWGVFVFLAALEGMPRSVIIINWILAISTILSIRMIARWMLTNSNKGNKNVIIYGAGEAGRQLVNLLKQSTEYSPVAFVDDSKDKQKQYINGLEVLPPKRLALYIKSKNVEEVILAMPESSRAKRNAIIEFIRPLPVHVRSLPSLSEIAGGRVKIEDLREINIKDLLGRDPVEPNFELLKTKITGKVVLVTGAGGSIGSEICRQVVELNPKRLILFERSENALYQIEQQLNLIKPRDLKIVPILGSVSDEFRIKNTLEFYKVQTIYHAAAFKHVPLVEMNKAEGVFNNSIGTLITANAAIHSKVETFVLISTDKAVRPTSTMGASKRVAEMIIQALAKKSKDTCLTMVRFGNVLDSSGSVIPLFKKQIKAGGPITVTDKNIVRYFMTIPEAVELVIQAGAMGKGGEVFVLDMGEPVKIKDLAEKMIQLSGLQLKDKNNPDGDIEIKYVGLRPGEKLYEELLVGENNEITENPLINMAKEEMIDLEILLPIIKELELASKTTNMELMKELLLKLVPEFKTQKWE
jgi:FlaA1/EpsC-like NDP-sugar epimerase